MAPCRRPVHHACAVSSSVCLRKVSVCLCKVVAVPCRHRVVIQYAVRAPTKGSSDDTIQQFLKRDYKYGFVSDIELVSIPKSLSEETVCLISAKKKEPEWMLNFCLNAYKQWLKMKEPTWSDNRYPAIDFQNVCYYTEPKRKETKQSLDEVDPDLLKTLAKQLVAAPSKVQEPCTWGCCQTSDPFRGPGRRQVCCCKTATLGIVSSFLLP